MANPVLAGAGQDTAVGFQGMPTRPITRGGRDYDAVSQASSAYVGKRTAPGGSKRQMSAQSRTIKLTPGAKAFYPNGYYKRVGYEKSEAASSNARVDALGQRVRDRFNEDAGSEYEQGRATGGGLQTRTLK